MKGLVIFWIIALCGVFFGVPYQAAEAQTTTTPSAGASDFTPIDPPSSIDGQKVITPSGATYSGTIQAGHNNTSTVNKIYFTTNNFIVSVPEKSGYHIFNYTPLTTQANPTQNKFPIHPYIYALRQLTTGGFSNSAGTNSFNSVSGNDTKLAMSFSFYDINADVGADQNYYFYIEVIQNGKDSQSDSVLMPISKVIQYQPTRADSSKLIKVTRNSNYDKGSDGTNFPTDSSGNKDLGLKIELTGPLLKMGYIMGFCSFTFTYIEANQVKTIIPNTDPVDEDGAKVCENKQFTTYKPGTDGSISIPWPNIQLQNGINTFKADAKVSISNIDTRTVTDSLVVNYNSTTGQLTNAAFGSAQSAINSPNGNQDDIASNPYQQCLDSFNKSYTLKHIIQYNVIGKPLCGLIDIIVSFSTDLATYAITYFLKPALGLS